MLSGKTAWARNLEAPLRDFVRTETGSAAFLLFGAVAALVWANAGGSSYERVWHTMLSITIGGHGITQDLRHWVNDGLMALFFFVVGLEARREFDLGELRDRRRLALPFVAGIGGMVVPVAIYLAINSAGAGHGGWGAAMSTDTAFALGMLALVGRRFPDSLRAFILTVAVVDDLVALAVIAIVFTGTVQMVALVGRAGGVRRDPRRPGHRRAQRGRLRHARGGRLGGVPQVRRRSDRRRSGDGTADDRLPGGAVRSGARHRPVSRLSRAADLRTAAIGTCRAAFGDLAQRALDPAVSPLHQLSGGAAVRAGQRWLCHQRQLPGYAPTARRSRSASWPRISWASRWGSPVARGWSPASARARSARRSAGRRCSAAVPLPASASPSRY